MPLTMESRDDDILRGSSWRLHFFLTFISNKNYKYIEVIYSRAMDIQYNVTI